MQFSGGKKDKLDVPNNRLQMYKIPPTDTISLEEFEEFAIERLKVLREVEMLGIREKKDNKGYLDGMRSAMKKLWKYTYHANDEHKKMSDFQEKLQDETRRDNTSHFILRLAYCRSDELRRWFIAQEVDLFKYRFQVEAEGGPENFECIRNFLKKNGLNYNPISPDEKKERRHKLAAADYRMDESAVKDIDFYKVPFTEALDLVRSRKVYLEKGYAYVPKDGLVSIISNCFRTHLSHALALTARSLPYLEEDERLLPRLTNLSRQYLGQGYESKKALPGGKITLDQIDSLSKKSYPLCMRQLHEALRRDHHLKHGGRMQYGLFLKGIGLTLEEALMFWRNEFTRIIEVDKFDKQYAYNIRHSFGKEGKRTDYTPYSCMKIILSNHPGQGDYHGCPFRHSDPDILRQKLVAYGVPKSGIDEILKLVKESHYQLACARYFELTHKVSLEHADAINHPNKYVEESRRVYESLEKGSIKQEPTANSSIDRVGQIVGMKTEQVTPSSSQKPFNNVKIEPMDGVKDDVNYDDDMDDFNDEEVMDINKLGY